MQTFTVQLHKEDAIEEMKVQKVAEDEFAALTEGGTRHLFELDTNIGFFIFFDAEDTSGKESYLVLHYEENPDEEDPSACYSFELKDFYQFTALYLNDLEFREELDTLESEDEEYGPIHHLGHIMYHVVEADRGTEETGQE
ncbi:cytosolic protein [Metabacillus sp. GX 13764]|uniref:cytosolic protein n=1 Tax=Metabacillus kandeliae TaxID=2900151 RepID=UPI001E512ADC|nr:cytosolic protein [Metabacillus kandeliae]MCD7035609.1 cytosolic protein [Metabacillus kandeliae]